MSMEKHCLFNSYLLLITTLLSLFTLSLSYDAPSGGEWQLLQNSIGLVAMHTQVLRTNEVIMFDRTDFGTSNISLPNGKCRTNDKVVKRDCSAHSVLYDIASNTLRPLMVQTNTWCSSGFVDANGTLFQTGGFDAGYKVVRNFSPCYDDACDWVEYPPILWDQRWYATDQILPDGRAIIIGGRNVYNYEFFPKKSTAPKDNVSMPFLRETYGNAREERNLYPFVYLLPDGNLYIFANTRSILFDYKTNTIIKEYPPMPGDVGRNYPLTGSSVMLPIKLKSKNLLPEVEVMVCGGAAYGNTIKAHYNNTYLEASRTCGRLKVTDPNPQWVMEEMPTPRVNNDMLVLPTGDVLIINGGMNGTAGYDNSVNPVFNPVLYKPNEDDPYRRFVVLNPSTIPRMYHSSAVLLPDGRILVGGSNPHDKYDFTTNMFPTELRLEAFSPPYLDQQRAHLRPWIMNMTNETMSYNLKFSFNIWLSAGYLDSKHVSVVLIAPPFTTHSFGMNQRALILDKINVHRLSDQSFKVFVLGPPSATVAPAGYYMMFVVNSGIPSEAAWVKVQ